MRKKTKINRNLAFLTMLGHKPMVVQKISLNGMPNLRELIWSKFLSNSWDIRKLTLFYVIII